jgi:hypothetical protein
MRCHAPAIFRFPNPADPASILHPVQQPGDIWHAVDEPVPDLISRQPFRPRASQDAKHVVLRKTDTRTREQFLQWFPEGSLGARDAQCRLLLEAAERLSLLKFTSQSGCHGIKLRVITPNVNTRTSGAGGYVLP